MSKIRDVSPFLQKLRNFLMGRTLQPALRFDPDVASRSPPLPNLPDGPSHKLAANYYYSRDARREVAPPLLLAGGHKQIGKEEPKPAATVGKTPGRVYNWDV